MGYSSPPDGLQSDAAQQQTPGAPIQQPSDSLIERVEHFVTETIPDAAIHVIEAIADFTTTPEEKAMERMEHVNELHGHMMEALSRGDVDGAAALNALAESELNSAVMHLKDPDYKDPPPLESHPDAGPPMAFLHPPDETPQVPHDLSHHAGEEYG
ncbi:MAG: hypothetical protein M3081_03665 [Gemmatimonadota bacterium]|nr:hypothetical protein [Gemmatimonadota bacterium]